MRAACFVLFTASAHAWSRSGTHMRSSSVRMQSAEKFSPSTSSRRVVINTWALGLAAAGAGAQQSFAADAMDMKQGDIMYSDVKPGSTDSGREIAFKK